MTKQQKIIYGSIVAAAIIVAAILLSKGCNQPKPDVIAAIDSTQYYKNKLGQEVAAIKQREQDYYKAKEGYLDSIAKLYNTKQQLLAEVIAIRQEKRTVIPASPTPPQIIYKKDTVQADCPTIEIVEQGFSSRWADGLASINLLNRQKSSLQLHLRDSLTVVSKVVKEGNIFNRREYLQFDVANNNPDATIIGLNIFRKPLPKPKKFGIGPQVGFGFSRELKPAIYAGVGITYSIIRF